LPDAYLNKFVVCAVLNDKTAQSKGPARLGVTLPEDWDRACFWNIMLL